MFHERIFGLELTRWCFLWTFWYGLLRNYVQCQAIEIYKM